MKGSWGGGGGQKRKEKQQKMKVIKPAFNEQKLVEL